MTPEHIWYSAETNGLYVVSKEFHEAAVYLRARHKARRGTIYLGEL